MSITNDHMTKKDEIDEYQRVLGNLKKIAEITYALKEGRRERRQQLIANGTYSQSKLQIEADCFGDGENHFIETTEDQAVKMICHLANKIERLEKKIEDHFIIFSETDTHLEEQIKKLHEEINGDQKR